MGSQTRIPRCLLNKLWDQDRTCHYRAVGWYSSHVSTSPLSFAHKYIHKYSHRLSKAPAHTSANPLPVSVWIPLKLAWVQGEKERISLCAIMHTALLSTIAICCLFKKSLTAKQLGILKNERGDNIRNKYICLWLFEKVAFRIKNNKILHSELKVVHESSKITGYN